MSIEVRDVNVELNVFSFFESFSEHAKKNKNKEHVPDNSYRGQFLHSVFVKKCSLRKAGYPLSKNIQHTSRSCTGATKKSSEQTDALD